MLASEARRRFIILILSAFAVSAVAICGIGLFGVLSAMVAERRRELGVRAALGASRRHIVRIVVTQGLGMAASGLVLAWSPLGGLAAYCYPERQRSDRLHRPCSSGHRTPLIDTFATRWASAPPRPCRSPRRLCRSRPSLLIATLLTIACQPSSEPAGSTAPAPGLEAFQVESDGHGLAVWGRVPERPDQVVLLLHGRTWSIRPDFDLRTQGQLSLMERLADEDVGVYGLDARGYGATPRDETGWLEPDRMAQDVRSVLIWLRERHPDAAPPVVLGWSYGSAIAHLTSQRWPELVSGVSLYGYFKNPATQLPVSDSPADPPRVPTTREGALSDFITPGVIDSTDIEAFVAAALEADPVRVDIRNAHQLNALSPDSLTVPAQILQGERDPIAPTPVQAALFEGLGTAHKEWIVLPGCDHAAHLETCKERFESAFLRFVREVG